MLLSPLLLVVALLVKAEDGGHVFFRQERVGYRGRPFCIWKFRTMVPAAAARGLPLTVGRDPRVTRVGAWLRRWTDVPVILATVRQLSHQLLHGCGRGRRSNPAMRHGTSGVLRRWHG